MLPTSQRSKLKRWKESSFGIDLSFLFVNCWLLFIYCLWNRDVFLFSMNYTGSFNVLSLTVAYMLIFCYLIAVYLIIGSIKFLEIAIVKQNKLLTTNPSLVSLSNRIISLFLCIMSSFWWMLIIGEVWMYRKYDVHLLGTNIFAVFFHPFTFLVIFGITSSQVYYFIQTSCFVLVCNLALWYFVNRYYITLQLSDRKLLLLVSFIQSTLMILVICLYPFSTLQIVTILLGPSI